jgi:hypothetical protein
MNDRRRVRWKLVAMLCGIVGVVLIWRPPTDHVAAQTPPPSSGEEMLPAPAKSPPHRWVGTASCGAASCHGRTAPPGSVGAEYTTFITRDPHAKAYEVLFDERSVRMAALLREEMQGRPAHESPWCLNCHAPSPQEFEPQAKTFDRSFGVGCEECHGPASDWLNPHTTAAWQRRGWQEEDADYKFRFGMYNSKDLYQRAAYCPSCHVGMSGNHLTHDMIAAGHPRLVFEFSSFHERLPKHWRERRTAADPRPRDRDRYPDWDARAWVVGQLLSTAIAMDRFSAHTLYADDFPGSERLEPEFADFDCGACHQRVRPAGQPPTAGLPLRYGSLVPSEWSVSLLPQALELAGVDVPDRRELLNAAAPFSGPNVTPTAILGSTRRTIPRLGGLAERAALQQLDPTAVRRVIREIVSASDSETVGWDRALQSALALQSLHRMLRSTQPQANDAAISRLIDDLVADVWPRATNGKPADPGSAAAKFQRARFAERLRELRDAIQ